MAVQHPGTATDRPNRARWTVSLAPALRLAVTVAVTAVATASVTVYVTANYFGPDLGWSVFSTEVKSERKVTIDHNLEVTHDFTLSGEGSVMEMIGVDCSREQPSSPGSGRFCFDRTGGFMVSENGGGYRPFVQPGPAGQNGEDGKDGAPGRNGADGKDGLHCWDTNGNGRGDSAEDLNGDKLWTAQDCKGFVVG